MKRRLVLITIILAVITASTMGLWWYIRQNSGKKLLTRAEVALSAGLHRNALQHSMNYLEDHPDDWRGYVMKSRALIGMGQYEQARVCLDETDRFPVDKVVVGMLRADTYIYPAVRTIQAKDGSTDPAALTASIDSLNKANELLELIVSDEEAVMLDGREYMGINSNYIALAHGAMADIYGQQATVTEASGQPALAEQHLQLKQTHIQSRADAQDRAIELLLPVVTADATRPRAAKVLVDLCLFRKDAESLSLAKQAILPNEKSAALPAAILTLYDAQELLQDAQLSESIGELEKMDEFLQALIERDPDQIRIKVIRAKLAMQMRRGPIALSVCNDILTQEPAQYEARLIKGSALLEEGRPAEAAEILNKLRTDFINQPNAHYAYAVAARAAQVIADEQEKTRLDPLIKDALRAAAQLDPKHAGALQSLAEVLLEEGFYDRAFEDAFNFYRAYPDNPIAVGLMARSAWLTEQVELAGTVLARARESHPDDPIMLMTVAKGYDQGEQDQLKAEVCQQVISLTVETDNEIKAVALAYAALGEHHEERGNFRQARQLFESALDTNPNSSIHKTRVARILYRIGDLAGAEAMLAQISEPMPAADLLRVQIRMVRGESVDFQQILSQVGSGTDSSLRLATMYLENGEPAKCIELGLAELEKDPANIDLMILLARAYEKLGQVDDSIKQWTAIIEATPQLMPAYMGLSRLLYADGGPTRVQEHLDKIEAARKELVYMAVGAAFAEAGQLELAAQAYAGAVDTPTASGLVRGTARMNLAGVLVADGKLDESQGELDRLSKQAGWQVRALQMKAQILIQANRRQEAVATLGQLEALAVDTAEPESFQSLIGFYLSIKQPEKALAICDLMEKVLGSSMQQDLLRATVYGRIGQAAQAIPLLEKALEQSDKDMDVHIALVKVLDAAGRPGEAMVALNRLAEISEVAENFSLFERGQLYLRWGLPDRSVECFRKLKSQGFDNDPRISISLGLALAQAGRSDEARETLKEISPHSDEYVSACQILTSLAKTPDQRVEILTTLLQVKPDEKAAVIDGISAMLGADRAEEACKLFDNWLAIQPKDTQIQPLLGMWAIRAKSACGNYDDASSLAEKMAASDGEKFWQRLAAILKLQTSPELVESVIPAIEKVEINDGLLGLVCAGRNNDSKSVQKWADLIGQFEKNPPELPARNPQEMMILAYLAAGRTDQAQSLFNNLPAAEPMSKAVISEQISAVVQERVSASQCLNLLEFSLAQQFGLNELAKKLAMELLAAQPDCKWAAWTMALGNNSRQSLGQLLELLEKNESAKNWPLLYLLRGEILLSDGLIAESLEQFAKASDLDKENLYLLGKYASVLELAGKLPAALEKYRQVYDATGDPILANNVAYLLGCLYPDDPARLAEANQYLEAAMNSESVQIAFRETKAWLDHLQGRTDQARPVLWLAVKAMPASPEVHYHLGLVESKVGQAQLGKWHLEAAAAYGESAKRSGITLTSSQLEAVKLASVALAAMESTNQ